MYLTNRKYDDITPITKRNPEIKQKIGISHHSPTLSSFPLY